MSISNTQMPNTQIINTTQPINTETTCHMQRIAIL